MDHGWNILCFVRPLYFGDINYWPSVEPFNLRRLYAFHITQTSKFMTQKQASSLPCHTISASCPLSCHMQFVHAPNHPYLVPGTGTVP